MTDQQQAPPLGVRTSPGFHGWLRSSKLSIAFTTYQTNRLFLVGAKDNGRLSVFERNFEHPMGLWASPNRLVMSTAWQLWELTNALAPGEVYGEYDRLFVPRRAYTTGALDVHDVAIDGADDIVFVNTQYSCLATTSERYSFRPVWQPPFISQLVPEDRCHLNGLAMQDGRPAYVTAVSRSDVVAGWRARREEGGCLIDVASGEIVTAGLSMPHSPRLHDGRLLVLNSGTGELGEVDRSTGGFEPIVFIPGFARGLAFAGGKAIVGLSKPRGTGAFEGLTLDERLRDKDADARCGVYVIDLASGVIEDWMELDGVVVELYDVQVLPGVTCPTTLGFRTDDIARVITIDTGSGPSTRVRPPKKDEATSAPSENAPAPDAEADLVYRSGNDLARQGRFEEAIERYVAALVLRPDHLNALLNTAAAQTRLGRTDAAVDCLERAIAAAPSAAEPRKNIAMLKQASGDLTGAIGDLRVAVQLAPNDAETAALLGIALYHDGAVAEAKGVLDGAIALDRNCAQAHNALGAVAKFHENFDRALEHHTRAADLAPHFFEARENVGKIHEDEGRVTQAKAEYAKATKIRPDALLELHMELLCPPVFESADAVDSYRKHANEVLDAFSTRDVRLPSERIESTKAEPPYDWAYHGRDNLELKTKHAALFAPSFSAARALRPRAEPPWHVGFVVTPGHEGVFGRCMAGIVNRLDRVRFDPTVFCPRAAMPLLRSALTDGVTIAALPLRFDHAAQMLANAELDVLYFWEVGTDTTNHFLPFLRLAPVQCTGWGWPDTSGAPELDLHITSDELAPSVCEERFSERLVRMPDLPAWFERPQIPKRVNERSRYGLSDDANLYLCVQTLRKVHPDFDTMIEGILEGDPDGVVVFVEDKHAVHGELLRARWRERLPDVANRIVMLPRLEPDDYAHVVANADVVLDTLHFGGTMTTYDALAAGVAVVTLPGDLPRSRYAAALCTRAGVAERCVADAESHYIAKAVTIGTNPVLRRDLRDQILASDGIFESPAATSQLEDVLTASISRT